MSKNKDQSAKHGKAKELYDPEKRRVYHRTKGANHALNKAKINQSDKNIVYQEHESKKNFLIAEEDKSINVFSKNILEDLYSSKPNSKSSFYKVFEITRLPIKTLAGQVFELTPKTLNSYRQSGKNIPIHIHELSLMINELYIKGKRIFGSTENFNIWMKKDSYGLGGMKPIEIINTVTGIEMIIDELVSIEFGTTA